MTLTEAYNEIRKLDNYNSKNNSIRIYKYIDISGAKLLMKNETLKFTKPSCFNDPFDIYSEIISTESPNLKELDYDSRLKVLSKFSDMNTVSCFSLDYKSILMWSHYSNSHKGLCIGFDIDLEELSNKNINIFKVNYSEKFESQIWNDENEEDLEKVINYQITTKFRDWIYEKEIRLVSAIRPLHEIVKFSSFARIKEIYLGLNIEKDDLQYFKKITRLISNSHLLYKMKPISGKFAITRERLYN